MKDKSKLTAFILVIVTIIVVIISAVTQKDDKDKKNNIHIVKNYSNFYTVNSCLYRVTTYISSKDTESLTLTLSENYKKRNKVTTSNVLEFFDNIASDYTFVSKKMYYQVINKNLTKYYVYGIFEKNQLFEDEDLSKVDTKDAYFIVYLNSSSKIFSIEPYDGEIFDGGDIDE